MIGMNYCSPAMGAYDPWGYGACAPSYNYGCGMYNSCNSFSGGFCQPCDPWGFGSMMGGLRGSMIGTMVGGVIGMGLGMFAGPFGASWGWSMGSMLGNSIGYMAGSFLGGRSCYSCF